MLISNPITQSRAIIIRVKSKVALKHNLAKGLINIVKIHSYEWEQKREVINGDTVLKKGRVISPTLTALNITELTNHKPGNLKINPAIKI